MTPGTTKSLNDGKDLTERWCDTWASPRAPETVGVPVRRHEGRRGQAPRQLDSENARLKQLVAEAELDKAMLKELAQNAPMTVKS